MSGPPTGVTHNAGGNFVNCDDRAGEGDEWAANWAFGDTGTAVSK